MGSHCKKFLKDNSGVAFIEGAIILPVLTLLFFGVIQFGIYLVKYELVTRAVNTAINLIQTDITISSINTDSTGTTDVKDQVSNPGGLVDFTVSPSYICAQSYKNEPPAGTGCGASVWNTLPPQGVAPGATYWVLVSAHLVTNIPSPLVNQIKFIDDTKVIQLGSSVTANTASSTGSVATHIQKLSGSGNWQVPDGVTAVHAIIIGGGGGGGGGGIGEPDSGSSSSRENLKGDGYNGGGGGSSAVVIADFTNLTPGDEINYGVGGSGKGGVGVNISGSDGSASFFDNIIVPGGGAGSGAPDWNWPSTPGKGATVSLGQTPTEGTVSYIVQPGSDGGQDTYGASTNYGGFYGGGADTATPLPSSNYGGYYPSYTNCLTTFPAGGRGSGGQGGQAGGCGHNGGQYGRQGGAGGIGAGAGGGGGGGGGATAGSGISPVMSTPGAGGDGADGLILLEY